MNEKKEKIITTAIDLFAEKGFHTTSIQEISEKSNVSKGAFYLHFHSKDELLLEIFKYYYELMNTKIREAVDPNLKPKDNFVRQVQVQIEEIMKHSSFIITQLREQAITLNKDLFDFIRLKEIEMQKWYEDELIAIYGPEVMPYVMDIMIMYEGIKSSYLQVLIREQITVDFKKLSEYTVNRLDTLVTQLLSEQEIPVVTKKMMKDTYSNITSPQAQIRNEVTEDLVEMEKILRELSYSTSKMNELQGVIDFLLAEVKKEEPKKFVIQGMLANLKGIPEFDKHRKWISQKLDVRLL
ncbi:TetR/AcrR family transcriptional regulator [Aquibacillus kalidii]|uniref:TetR/AcrR family transcriptional regulator n=1 Tax=Aquibacillus kalidii TaxID=2762597 RepID=UPI001647E485|nr:TetR/AcrR family transcriptional regulator [Aquibacillus kalidii]